MISIGLRVRVLVFVPFLSCNSHHYVFLLLYRDLFILILASLIGLFLSFRSRVEPYRPLERFFSQFVLSYCFLIFWLALRSLSPPDSREVFLATLVRNYHTHKSEVVIERLILLLDDYICISSNSVYPVAVYGIVLQVNIGNHSFQFVIYTMS